jgi:hypothetical protein
LVACVTHAVQTYSARPGSLPDYFPAVPDTPDPIAQHYKCGEPREFTRDNLISGYYTVMTNTDKAFKNFDSELGFSVDDFGKWLLSDLISNSLRGKLAEFIVSKALGIQDDEIRSEWNAYDLEYGKHKIEVKSSAYIQSWNRPTGRYANPQFGIGTKKGWDAKTNTIGELKRHANLYVFCMFKCKDWGAANPLQVDQWDFYVVTTDELNEKLPDQKTIGLASLTRIFNVKPVSFEQVKLACDEAMIRD